MDKKNKSLRDHQQITSVTLNTFCLSSKSPPHSPVLNKRQHKTGWNSMELYVIQTGITCKKTIFYMYDSDCRWLIVKNAKKI